MTDTEDEDQYEDYKITHNKIKNKDSNTNVLLKTLNLPSFKAEAHLSFYESFKKANDFSNLKNSNTPTNIGKFNNIKSPNIISTNSFNSSSTLSFNNDIIHRK